MQGLDADTSHLLEASGYAMQPTTSIGPPSYAAPHNLHWPTNCSLQNGPRASAVLKSNGVSHFLAQHHIHLVSHTLSHAHGRHSPRLGTTNQLLLSTALGKFCQPLRNLCRLIQNNLYPSRHSSPHPPDATLVTPVAILATTLQSLP
jgi:hypothetical protein